MRTTEEREVNKLAQRRYVERQKETTEESFRKYRRAVNARWQGNNRSAHNAHNAVYRAIKRGQLTRPAACSRCGTPCRPEASHDDYSRPLAVEWLCRQCHTDKDITGRPTGLADQCKAGHVFSEENTYIAPTGQRQCRACRRTHKRRYRENNRRR